jgi:hypothetical protein
MTNHLLLAVLGESLKIPRLKLPYSRLAPLKFSEKELTLFFLTQQEM